MEKYVFRYLYDPSCYTLINEVRAWIEENSLQDEIDEFVGIPDPVEHHYLGSLEDFIVFGCKTEESVLAFKLRWE